MDKGLKMTIRDLNFYYGDSRALHDISLDFRTHEVMALIGPSGCGKSTLLRCLNRMNDLIPHGRVEGQISWMVRTSTIPVWMWLPFVVMLAWYFKSRTLFLKAFLKMWPTVYVSMG